MPWFMVLVIVGLSWAYFAITPANGHQAQSGWEYPRTCCSPMNPANPTQGDCREIPASWVTFLGDGYEVTIPAGEMPWNFDRTVTAVFPEQTDREFRKIHDSPDGRWHVCVGPRTETPYCLFVVKSLGV